MSGRLTSAPAADSPRDFGTDSEGKARRWHAELDKARKESERWLQDSRRILDRYKDIGPGRRGVGMDATFGMKFNILWSNIQTLAPSLYASTPQVVIERRWGDEDDLGRVACQILQRNAQYQLDAGDFDTLMRSCVLDHLIAGRGTAWVRYEPHFDRHPTAMMGTGVMPGASPVLPAAPPALPPPQPAMGVPGAGAAPPMPSPPPTAPPAAASPMGPGGAPFIPGAGVPGGAPPPPMPPQMPPGAAAGPPGVPGALPPPAPAMPAPAPPQPPLMPMAGIPIGHMMDDELVRTGRRRPLDGGLQVGDDGEQDNAEFVAYEEVKLEHVHWEDFLTNPARTWPEVRWVARRVYMTQDEGIRRFGAFFKDVPLDWVPRDIGETEAMQPENRLFRRATVWEIWDKPSRKVQWIATAFLERLLDERDDPLRLSNFFPCPMPLYATLTTDSLIPVPDYALYRDQAVQIDTLTARIEGVSKAIKVAGVYDSSQDGIKRMMAEGVENQLIPVQQWGAFAQQGGLKGCFDLLDIGMLANVLEQLVNVRAQAKNDLYEVTGISDIIRGTSAAAETATAQQIKAGFGTMRLRSRQNEVARFARDLIRLVCEVVCEHFTPRVIAMIADVGAIAAVNPPDAQMIPRALAMLRDENTRQLRIDIETDSMIMANHQQEQQARIQFLQMASQFLQQSVPAATQQPAIAPLLGQMLLFGIRSFPQGAELEGAFETAIKQLEQMAQQHMANPQPPPPDPKLIVAQAQVRNIDSQIQDRQMRSMAEAQDDDAHARVAQAKVVVDKQRADDEAARHAVEAFHDRRMGDHDYMLEVARLHQQAIDAHQDRQIEKLKAMQPKGNA